MSLRMLQKQVGAAPSEGSQEAKAVTHAAGRSRPAGHSSGSYSGGGGYDSGQRDDASYGGAVSSGGGGYYDSKRGEGAGATRAAAPAPAQGTYTGAARVLAPAPGNFRGSDAQRAHVEAVRRAAAQEAASSPRQPAGEVAVRSDLGLEALKERKRREEEEKNARREAARAKRRTDATQQEVEDEVALMECEEQARADAAANERVKYEAALIVRIAVRFGTSGVWMKIAEARARGAEIPLDPRRVYLLAHPDKCPLAEASDATAILNAQRPPEMTEVRTKPVSSSVAAAAAEKVAASKAARAPAAAEVEPETAPDEEVQEEGEERRTDPEDGKEVTLDELRVKYKSCYTPEDIEEYWKTECQPLKSKAVAQQRKTRRF